MSGATKSEVVRRSLNMLVVWFSLGDVVCSYRRDLESLDFWHTYQRKLRHYNKSRLSN